MSTRRLVCVHRHCVRRTITQLQRPIAQYHIAAARSTYVTPVGVPSSYDHRSFSSGNHDGNHHRQPTSRVVTSDYYQLLEVNRYHLRDGDLKQAYHRLAKQYHPDRLIHLCESDRKKAEKRFAEIGVAYSVLSNTEKKQTYDIFMDLSSIGDQDRMLHWIKINRPPEQLGFEGFTPAYEGGYEKSAHHNASVTPVNDATPPKPSKPKMPVFRSS